MGKIVEGDCLEVMRGMEENSVDAVVTDPPYGLEFMGMKWDRLGNVGEGKSKTPSPSKSGQPFNERIGRVSYNASQNVRCRKCKHWKFSGTPCKCASPDFPNLRSAQAQAMQGWHFAWACEALRVAKPGAYLLAFGGTRTFHRLACAIEDAGWILRDTLMWCYGSGFPKSHAIGKALDRKAGAEREVAGRDANFGASKAEDGKNAFGDYAGKWDITAPATPEAKQWDGFGTALKPAWEPIILAQKPLEGTYAENVLKWGCGALNIDGCRIGKDIVGSSGQKKNDRWSGGWPGTKPRPVQGRWPANFLMSHTMFCECEKVGEKRVRGIKGTRSIETLYGSEIRGERAPDPPAQSTWSLERKGGMVQGHADPDGLETVEDWRCAPDCPVRMLDEQSGVLKSGDLTGQPRGENKIFNTAGATMGRPRYYKGDQGGASRFFYCAKASRRERNAGLEGRDDLFEKREGFGETTTDDGREKPIDNPYLRGETKRTNSHPTVKPIALMRYLCRLVMPPKGKMLDPFAGSGSTGCAAVLEGFDFCGIEKEKGYAEIARARIAHFSQGKP